MKRQVSLEEISDGKLYSSHDMVKAGCGGCQGCSSCCQGMGSSIILDPMDLYRLTMNLGMTFEALMADKIELNVVDGIILPNLKMSDQEEKCGFLDKDGRCSIHAHRPGICRLFPLGRYYEDRTFRYFLQVYECSAKQRTKVKVNKWVDTPELARYEQYICTWHYFLEDVQQKLENMDEEQVRNASLYILKLFYMKSYHGEAFYLQFEERMAQAREVFEL